MLLIIISLQTHCLKQITNNLFPGVKCAADLFHGKYINFQQFWVNRTSFFLKKKDIIQDFILFYVFLLFSRKKNIYSLSLLSNAHRYKYVIHIPVLRNRSHVTELRKLYNTNHAKKCLNSDWFLEQCVGILFSLN